jgi:hypothetical protein
VNWLIHARSDIEQFAFEPENDAGQPGTLPSLLPELQTQLGTVPRRISRFTQLALLGVARCRPAGGFPPDTALYLSSARGDLDPMLAILQALYRDGQSPKPLQFINAVNNATCFYVAQVFGLRSKGLFIANLRQPFECALQLAGLDLASGRVASALVGCVDILTLPLAEHRRRFGLAADARLSELSRWQWIGRR